MSKVGLVFGGRSVEHRVSVVSARTVAGGLRDAGYEVVPLGVDQDGALVADDRAAACLRGEEDALLPVGDRRAGIARWASVDVDVLFPITHGTYGEDGTFQGLAETLQIPYVGPGVAASAVAMDKILCKRVLENAGVRVVPFSAVRPGSDLVAQVDPALRAPAAMPIFVKPTVGGSSVGIRKVKTPAELEDALKFALQFWDEALVERGVIGRELEVAVLGHRDLEASRVGEIVPGRDFYDYEDKYLSEGAKLFAPADLPAATERRIRDEAIRAFAAIGGQGMARVDFFLTEEDDLYLNEINTLPGFTSISMYPRLWAISGIALPALIDRLVQIALERARDRGRFDDALKAFVSSV